MGFKGRSVLSSYPYIWVLRVTFGLGLWLLRGLFGFKVIYSRAHLLVSLTNTNLLMPINFWFFSFFDF